VRRAEGHVAVAQFDVGTAEQFEALELIDDSVGVGEEAPSFDD